MLVMLVSIITLIKTTIYGNIEIYFGYFIHKDRQKEHLDILTNDIENIGNRLRDLENREN